MRNQKSINGLLNEKTVLCSAALFAQALSTTSALAETSDAEVQELRSMIEKLQKKIDKIEETQKVGSVTMASSGASAAAAKPGNLLPEGVTIYGALDSGVERVTNVGPTKGTVTRVPSTTGYAPSMVGLDVRRKVNDSIAVVGKAEMGIYLDSGNSGQGNRLFGRQIYVGIDSPIGSLTFGRQYSMLLYGLQDGEIMGPNIQAPASFDSYLPNARHDNSVVWRAKFDKLSFGAHYSFGRDASSSPSNGNVPNSGICGGESASDASRCRSWSAMAEVRRPSLWRRRSHRHSKRWRCRQRCNQGQFIQRHSAYPDAIVQRRRPAHHR